MYWPNIAVKYAFWLWCFAAPTASCVLACVVSQETPPNQRTTCFGLLTLRQANMGYDEYSLHLIFTFYLNRDTSVLDLIPCRCISIKKIVRVDSSRRARDMAAMLDHLRHRGESATKTVKFFTAHTVNCVMCNDHTIIDWMLLNFTQVIQQNCHQPANRAESLRNHFAQLTGWAVNLSCQNPKPANSEAILFLIS